MIVGGSDDDIMSGDALAAGTGAVALANNTATATGTGGDYGDLDVFAGAGNDMLGSDGGEGGQGDSVVGGGDDIIVGDALRSAERRVGKGWCSLCGSRWSPEHSKK